MCVFDGEGLGFKVQGLGFTDALGGFVDSVCLLPIPKSP